jgi:hypothetical protein
MKRTLYKQTLWKKSCSKKKTKRKKIIIAHLYDIESIVIFAGKNYMCAMIFARLILLTYKWNSTLVFFMIWVSVAPLISRAFATLGCKKELYSFFQIFICVRFLLHYVLVYDWSMIINVWGLNFSLKTFQDFHEWFFRFFRNLIFFKEILFLNELELLYISNEITSRELTWILNFYDYLRDKVEECKIPMMIIYRLYINIVIFLINTLIYLIIDM